MQQAVGADEFAGIDGAFTAHVGGAATGLLNDEAERREIPRHAREVDGDLDGALRHQHVLPEAAEGAAVARGVQQAAKSFAHYRSFLRAGAGAEHHGYVERSFAGNVDWFPVAIGALAAISGPARGESGGAG